MGPIQIFPQDKRRATLLRVREWAKSKGINPEQVSYSYLRVGLLMENAKSVYKFPLRAESGESLVHDKKLDQNDSFVPIGFGLRLLAENPATPGVGILQTYPNVQEFPAVALETVHTHFNIFYNGFYEIKVDEKVYVPGFATDEMLCVRTTQKSAATNFSERIDTDGCVDLGADVTLNGSRKNSVTLTVPTFPGMLIQQVAAATRNYVVCYIPGFLIAGGGNIGTL